MTCTDTYASLVAGIAEEIRPLDDLEAAHRRDVLDWIQSGAPLCRTAKPATPAKHLVSYFVLYDPAARSILLVDHRKAQLWLPTGGHVEPGEDPQEAARRELMEELGVELPLLREAALFVTVTETVGLTSGHTDVSFWYAYLADSSETYVYDEDEFAGIRWFSLDALPLERTDPHLQRFCRKLLECSVNRKQASGGAM